MSVHALAASGEKVTNANTIVTSALAFGVQAYLPAINDGSGATVAVGTVIRVEVTGAAPVQLLTLGGVLVGTVQAYSHALVVARAGVIQGVADSWTLYPAPVTSAATVAAAPAGGVGDAVGAYDTAANRDALIATVNGIRTALIGAGILKAE